MEFKKGETYNCHIWAEGEPYKIHIVEVIDEGMSYCPMIVFRYYGKLKNTWFYRVEHASSVQNNIEIAAKDKENGLFK